MHHGSPRRPASRRTWPRKFADAFRGVSRAVRTQSSFAVHLGAAAAVGLLAATLRVSAVEWCLLVAAAGLVLVAEMVNTALESLARAIDTGRNPRIRDGLDIASGAVLVAAAAAAVIGLVVFGHRLGRLAGWW